MCSTQIWLDRLEDMWTGESQSAGELTHDGFFFGSIGIEFHEVVEWETSSLIGSYGISLQVK